ncbi:hypothetical protein QYS49_36920 [Marivirga salinae]|uniref:Nucleotidyltransferase n=1 Tax=Marivirga salinarum TaxID=3059078 RepID=A0AA51R8C0_9BACT|nr:hypothetical protein [Marivirga sp. BDSF4-3]WMN11027.1 hypothetical protein QYS49_36920 [Marivirga sp. BDSF4-3]
MSKEKIEHLECVLSSHKLSKEETLLEKHRNKRQEVREFLQSNYGNKSYNPFDSGSYAKNTAINTKFDFDLVLPFKRDSFSTLKEMYHDTLEVLTEKYKGTAYIKEQKVSIGLVFHADSDGHEIDIDVVPGRELNQDQYSDDKKLNLFVKKKYGILEEGSEQLRTNIHSQIQNIRNQADNATDIRKVIRLLKVWKVNNNAKMKSFLIELITIKAFQDGEITGNIWDKLKSVIEYIKDNIETVNLIDPGNGGNNVSETLTDYDKQMIGDSMNFILQRIENDSSNLEYYFPVNPKFPCESSKGKYGVKESGFSIPPATKFG